MSARLWIALGVCVVSVPLVAALVAREDRLEPPAPVADGRILLAPPTVGMTWTPDARVGNLELLGAEGLVRRRALETLARLDRRRDAVVEGLGRARRETLAATFCPHDIPVVYRAPLLLVDGAPGDTRVVDPTDEEFGLPWDGFRASDAVALFDAWEQRPDRAHADTLLALSALVIGRADDAVGERSGPWSRFAADGGRFGEVEAAYPDADRLLGDYLGVLHATAEIVSADPASYGCADAVGSPP